MLRLFSSKAQEHKDIYTIYTLFCWYSLESPRQKLSDGHPVFNHLLLNKLDGSSILMVNWRLESHVHPTVPSTEWLLWWYDFRDFLKQQWEILNIIRWGFLLLSKINEQLGLKHFANLCLIRIFFSILWTQRILLTKSVIKVHAHMSLEYPLQHSCLEPLSRMSCASDLASIFCKLLFQYSSALPKKAARSENTEMKDVNQSSSFRGVDNQAFTGVISAQSNTR